jgi:hypothetical protein
MDVIFLQSCNLLQMELHLGQHIPHPDDFLGLCSDLQVDL